MTTVTTHRATATATATAAAAAGSDAGRLDWLLPHQHQAVTDTLRVLDGGAERATVVMPCGTGKTRVGAALAVLRAPRRVLVLVPSLALVEQTLREWEAVGVPIDPVLVCSDPSTAAGAGERAAADRQNSLSWQERAVPVTTDADRLARLLSRGARTGTQAVFSTYHSLPTLTAAIRYAAAEVTFDLLLADEAHRLAGSPSDAFRLALDSRALPAHRRVHLTATPVVSDRAAQVSMDDEHLFGPVAHRLTFSAAIAAGLLADYQVVVVAEQPDAENPHASDLELAAHAALRSAAVEHHLTRVLAFHGRVRSAQRFAGLLTQSGPLADGRPVWARVVDAATPASERRATLDELVRTGEHSLAVLGSAQCLNEGVDVPAVDALVFCSRKESTVDIVQAVGRVLRRAPGKSRGTVIIPVHLPPEGDDDSELLASAFGHVWSVLRALRAHDERLGQEADRGADSQRRLTTASRGPDLDRVTWLLPPGVAAYARTRAVAELVTPWERAYRLLSEHAAATGSADVDPQERTADGFTLGQWVLRQRRAHRARLLPPERVARLEELSGWSWSPAEAVFRRSVAALTAAAVAHGGQLDYERLTGRAAGHNPPTLGVFAAAQRLAHRAGDLTSAQTAALEAVPGWRWQVLPHADVEMVDRLADFVAWEGHANIGPDYVDGTAPLGAWLARVRRLRVAGCAPAALLDEVTAATPGRYTTAALRWNGREALWDAGALAAAQYAAREGHLSPPEGHVEVVDGIDVRLRRWMVARRHEQRSGHLSAERAQRLAAIPGWRWEITPDPRTAIDVGHRQHGTRAAYAHGCRCVPCTEASGAYNRQREELARSGQQTTDYVDAAPVRRHLTQLLAAGVTRRAMVRATGLSRSALSELCQGTRTRVTQTTAQRLLELTPEDAAAAAADGTVVEAGPTWAILDELIGRGWPKSWLATELGLGATLQLNRRTVTARNARRVADLAERIGDLCPPARRHRQPTPPLEELLAATTRAA